MVTVLAATAGSAWGVHLSGSRYEIVGFSNDGGVLVRLHAVQYGTLRYELLDLADGRERVVRPVDYDKETAEAVEAALVAEHSIKSVGFLGPVAPGRGAAISLVPGVVREGGSFDYEVQLTDRDGTQPVALIGVPYTCDEPHTTWSSHARIEARWSPSEASVVVAGGVLVEHECGEPDLTPVLVIVRVRGRAGSGDLETLAGLLRSRLQGMERERLAEGVELATQLLAVAPGQPGGLLELARLRASLGNEAGAISALWALQRIPTGAATVALSRAMNAAWTEPLRRRAAYRALLWLSEARLEGPPFLPQ